MKHCFWLVFLIFFSVSSSFSIEKEEKTSYSPAEQCQRIFVNDDIFLVSAVTTRFAEMPVCPTNLNLRLWKKQNLQKKWSRGGNATSLYCKRDIKQKHAGKSYEKHARILFSRYKNGFYVYYLRKLLI